MYNVMTSGHQTVDAMGMINISGNITPQIWYSTITRPNGKPYLLAITLLADIVYWYRPVEVRDEQSGRVVGWQKRFSGQLLQKTYQQYADLYGESKRTIKAALDRLEELNIIKKEFHNVKYNNGVEAYNLMFIALNVDVLYRFTYPEQMSQPELDPQSGLKPKQELKSASESVSEMLEESNSSVFMEYEDDIECVELNSREGQDKEDSCVVMSINTYSNESGGHVLDKDVLTENVTLPPTKFCTPSYKMMYPLLQNDVPPPTKFCTTPLQNNVPPPTKFCGYTKNTTKNTNIDNINQSINQDNNNILILNGSNGMDGWDSYAQIVEQVKENIDYESLKLAYPYDINRVDEIVDLITEILCVKRESVRINGADYPYQLVAKQLEKLDYSHIRYVLSCMKNNTSKVGNIRAYLLTALFNAPSTMGNFYQAAVNHDMHGR